MIKINNINLKEFIQYISEFNNTIINIKKDKNKLNIQMHIIHDNINQYIQTTIK